MPHSHYATLFQSFGHCYLANDDGILHEIVKRIQTDSFVKKQRRSIQCMNFIHSHFASRVRRCDTYYTFDTCHILYCAINPVLGIPRFRHTTMVHGRYAISRVQLCIGFVTADVGEVRHGRDTALGVGGSQSSCALP